MPQNSNTQGESHSLLARVGAALIDTLIMAVLFPAMVIVGVFVAGKLPVEYLIAGFSLYAYKVFFEGFVDGQTIGKGLLNIRVTTERGDAITLRQAAIRNTPFLILSLFLAIPFLGLLLFLVGFGTYLVVGFLGVRESETNQRLFDRYAGTLVSQT